MSHATDSTVVVTGGAGFIGSHLVRALLDRGARRVVVLDSMRYGDPANLGSSDRVEIVRHTIGTDPPAELSHALAGADFLFHLAAEKHNQSKDDPSRVLQANVMGTLELYRRAVEQGVRKIVFSSSLYAYGRLSGPAFVETERCEPRTAYGVSKLAGEHLLGYVHELSGVRTSILRYLFVYGPRQYAGMGYKSVIVRSFERLLDGLPPIVVGDGRQALDYVYVDDAVEATIRALAPEADGEVVNVASGTGLAIRDLVDQIIAVAGSRLEPEQAPADWTAGSSRVGDPTRAAEVLGWHATTPLALGLARTFEWIRDRRDPAARRR